MKKGDNSEAFYRIPKFLFGDEYKNILSTDAKLLYALLLDRATLSAQNGWLAEDGRVFIYFTVDEAVRVLSFCKDKVIRLFNETENAGLIERKRLGRGKASVIYINNEVVKQDFSKIEFRKSEKKTSGNRKNRIQEVEKTECNNTEYNNNYSNETYLSSKEEWERQIKENIEYDIIISYRKKESIDRLVNVMAETLCGYAKTYRINGADIPYSDVKERFLLLDEDHIMYAVDVMDDINWKVRNIRSYMLTVLYNAPNTIDAYYQAMVNRDLGIS